jgi:hypothetical protein
MRLVARGPLALLAFAVCADLSACDREVSVGTEHTVGWPGGLAPCDPAAGEICNGSDDNCNGPGDEAESCADPCRVVKLGPRCALRADGEVFCWGLRRSEGAWVEELAPRRVSVPGSVVQVSQPCARTVDGRVHCWDGRPLLNSFPIEQLGDTVAEVVVAPPMPDLPDVRCARRLGPLAGTIWCWSQSIDGSELDERPVPIRALGTEAVQVAIGRELCARKRDGTIWCWSRADPLARRHAPALRPELGADNIALEVGGHVCVLARAERREPMDQATTTVVCAGDNQHGQLGVPSTVSGPVRVTAFGGDVTMLAVSDGATCALRAGGGVVCAGRNSGGELGGGTREDSADPVAVRGLERDVEEIVPFCARKKDGSLWCWGPAPVGDGSREDRLEPVRIDVCPEVRR